MNKIVNHCFVYVTRVKFNFKEILVDVVMVDGTFYVSIIMHPTPKIHSSPVFKSVRGASALL